MSAQSIMNRFRGALAAMLSSFSLLWLASGGSAHHDRHRPAGDRMERKPDRDPGGRRPRQKFPPHPQAPLTLQNAWVVTNQLSVSIPVR